MSDGHDPLQGVSDAERATMLALLRMRPEQQKEAPKVATAKGEAQRQRRRRERQPPSEATVSD